MGCGGEAAAAFDVSPPSRVRCRAEPPPPASCSWPLSLLSSLAPCPARLASAAPWAVGQGRARCRLHAAPHHPAPGPCPPAPLTPQEDAASCPFCSPSPRAAPSTPQQPVCLPTLGPKLKPSSPNPHLWVFRCPGCLTREAGSRVDPLEQLPGAELDAVVGVAGQHQLAHLHLRGAAAPHGPRRLLALPRLPAARGGALRRGEMLARGCGALARPR